MLKRKKLYCPIKHCVRIQIPRKGYFYRSTVRFKAPVSSSSVLRVDSSDDPKSRSKVQISGLASTGPKKPDLLKKGVKSHKDSRPVSESVRLRAKQSKSFSPARSPIPNPNSPLTNGVIERDFYTKVAGQFHRPATASPSGDKSRSVSNEIRQTTLEPFPNASKGKTWSSMCQKTPRESDDVAKLQETSHDMMSRCKPEILTPSETSLDKLLNCINSVLKRDDGLSDLEITPVRTRGRETIAENAYQAITDVSMPQSLHLEEVTSLDASHRSQEASALYLSPAVSFSPRDSDEEGDYGIPLEDNIARMMIGEIDLHFELENYLRTTGCFNPVRKRTKNTLQSNPHEDYHHLSGVDLLSHPDEYENISHSSFTSATSVCGQQDKDKLQVYLDRDHDVGSTLEEIFEAKKTKGFISQTEFSDKVGEMRMIKLDNDPKKKEYGIKSSIKRSFGKTSFQSLHQEEETSITSFQPSHSMDDLTDSYEKIHPLRTSSKDFEKTARCGSFILTKSENSLPVESFSANIRKVGSDSSGLKNTSEGNGIELEGSEVTNRDGMAGTQSEYERKWSPSLQELIEIYNNVLKQNKRLRSNSRACVSRCVSSHLLTFLNEELKEKECKANLLMLSKTLQKRLKTPTTWKPGKQSKDNTLAQYVSMFQEILNSSLTISQITQLNNIISGSQGISEKNCNIAKKWKASKKNKEVKKKQEELLDEVKTEVFSESDLENNPVPPEYCPERLKKKYLIEKPVKAEKPASVKFQGIRKKPQQPKPKAEEGDTKVKKVELPAPAELEAMLKSYFISEAAGKEEQKESQDKILVTVQMSGNQVLVSGLSYFKNEKALTPRKADLSGTSELIIENVTKEEVRDVWCKPTRSSKLRAAKRSSDELEKPKSEIKIKPKIEQKKMKGLPKAPAAVPPRKQIKDKCASIDNLLIRAVEERKSMVEFEYNQMQLRAQHPIEAIVESSESKISDHVENSEDDLATRNVVPPPEKKNPVKPIPKMKKLEEALKEALTGKVFSKDLTCDFGWNENPTEKSLTRTKSYMIGRETTHKEEVTKKKPPASTVRSLNDLKNNIKTRRKGRRVINSYVCYPSMVGLQEKYTAAAKQKPKKPVKQKSRSVYFSNSRVSDYALNNGQVGGNSTSSKDVQPDVDVLQESDTSGVNTVMDVNDVAPSCSSDLLDGDEGTSNNASPKVSTSTIKQNLQTSSEHLSRPIDPNATNCGKASADAVDTSNGSSIVIHAPKCDSDDMSFPSIMIHSDSFLKYYTSLPPGAQSNWRPLFKSNSDMKFYPGRVKSSETESGPLVKFVLTPSQNEAAELPASQVEVVDRKLVGEKDVNLRPQEKDSEEDIINEKISLASIEKFIKALSKNKKREKQEAAKSKPQVKEGNVAKSIQKKPLQVGHRRTPPKPTDRKVYHECQKRKLTEKQKTENEKPKAAEPRTKLADRKSKTPDNKAKADGRVKTAQKADGKTKKAGTKTPDGKPQSTTENSEINFQCLKNFMVVFSEMLETYQKYCIKSKAEKKDRESEQKTDVKVERHEEKATNTNSEEEFSLSRIFDLAVDSSIRPPQAVRSANTQTEDWFSEGTKIEPKSADQPVIELQTCGDLGCPPKTSAEVLSHRKMKRLKIKIPCDDPKRKSVDHNEASAAAEKQQQLTAQIGLLDSLEKRKSEVRVPEERIFFDATDDDSRSWSSRQREFLAFWATVDLSKLSNGLVVEESQRSLIQASLFPERNFVEGSTEFLCEKILLALRNGDICHSLGLLDDILHRAELSPESSDNSERLRNVLLLVISESKSLMINLEKNAWIKVLNLLEEVHRMCEGSNGEEPERGFINNVLKLNDRRLLDLQNVCCSLSQWDIKERSGRFGTVVHRIVNSMKHLKNRLRVRQCRFAHSIHRAGTLPEVTDDQNPLRRLRKEIQQRKRYIEFLMSADCGYIPQEVQDVKAKVVEKMRTFEKIFAVVGEGCRAVETPAVMSGSPWGKAVSLLNFTRT